MSATGTHSSTQRVVERHLQCFAQLDLEGILSDYAPDAILFTAKPGATFELARQVVVGEYAYILWSARTADQVYELATDTFLVRDGRIHMQSFAARTVPRP